MCKIFYVVNNVYYLKLNNKFSPRLIIDILSANTGMRKNSFAENFILNLFIELLSNSENLVETYHLFYQQEYDTFEDFLYKKELLELSNIQLFSISNNDSLWKLRLLRKRNSISNFITYDNENIMRINYTLKAIVNED